MDRRLLLPLLPLPLVALPFVGCHSPVADMERALEAQLQRPPVFFPITARTFNVAREEGWFSDLENPRFSLVLDPSAPGGPRVGEMRYPAGWPAGSSPAWSETRDLAEEGLTRIHLSFWVKVSENWEGHPAVSKIGFVWIHGKPAVFPVYRGTGSDPLTAQIWLQDVPDGGRRLPPNVGEREIVRGRWHHWEIVLVANEGDEADGEVHYWVDGRKLGEYREIRFGTAEQSDIWERFSWRPVWGGMGGAVRENMYMRMAEIVVSGPTPRLDGPHR